MVYTTFEMEGYNILDFNGVFDSGGLKGQLPYSSTVQVQGKCLHSDISKEGFECKQRVIERPIIHRVQAYISPNQDYID